MNEPDADHPGREGARTHSVEECKQFLDIFQRHGHNEVDTARIYTRGQSEEWLGELDYAARGITMDTKIMPTGVWKISSAFSKEVYKLTPADIRRGLERSLEALRADRVSIYYLHGPDRTTPIEETLRGVNDLYQEGKFERFGLSNFAAWEVAQICELANKNGWIRPSVYQGSYNALQRLVEPELFPCIRQYGMSFYCYGPLAGGFLTGRYDRNQAEVEEGSRFDPNRIMGSFHRLRYMNDTFFDAQDLIKAAAQKHGLTVAECALRWMSHHSLLKRDHGDAIIIGASSTKYLENNLADLEKGPLPEDVIEALENAWLKTKGVAQPYFH